MKPLPGFALVAVLALGTFVTSVPLIGCSPTAAQIQADGNAVAVAADQIANVLQVQNPGLAEKLHQGATALRAALVNWNTSSPTDVINTAANVIEVALAAIPQTVQYAPLVAIAVAALEVFLAQLPHNAAVQAMAREQAPNPWRGQATVGKSAKAFKAAWNSEAVKHPGFEPIQ